MGRKRFSSLPKLPKIKNILSKLALVILLIIMFALIVASGLIYRATRLQQHFAPASISTEQLANSGELNTLILVVDREGEASHISEIFITIQQQGNFLVIPIPVSLTKDIRDAPDQAAKSYQYKNLYNLYDLQIDDRQRIHDALSQEFQEEIGVRIDRYFIINDTHLSKFKEELDLEGCGAQSDSKNNDKWAQLAILALDYLGCYYGQLAPFTMQITLSSYLLKDPFYFHRFVSTNMNNQELSKLHDHLTANAGNYETIIIDSDYVFIKEDDPYLLKPRFDRTLREKYESTPLLLEQAKVDVLNGSGRAGLASQTKRILTNHGFNIIRVDDVRDSSQYDKPVLFAPQPEEYFNTIEKLKLFYPELTIKEQEYPHRTTGDVTLVVV